MSYDLSTVLSSIDKLYCSKDPQEIQSIQNDLTAIQKLDNGSLAFNLMQQSTKTYQFFGALTYTVLINRIQKFDKETLDRLLDELQGFIITSDGIVLKKLLSNISLLFIYNYENYQNPIEKLLLKLTNNGSMLQSLNNHYNESVVLIILMYCSILVEELIKKEKTSQIHEIIFDQVFNNLKLVFEYFNSTSTIPSRVDLQILDCLNSWITYISMAETQSKIRYDDNELLINFLFKHFDSSQLEILENDVDLDKIEILNKSISNLTDILEINPSMLNSNMKSYLKQLLFEENNWGQLFIAKFILNQEFEEEISNFINLIIVFIQLDSLNITKNITLPINEYIFNFLIKLTDFPGLAIIEEKISNQFLSFWDEFFNVFIDNEEIYEHSLDSLEKQIFYNKRNELCNAVCNIYWHKINFVLDVKKFEPSKSEFLYFRSNVGDFFSNVYSLLKLPFYEKLTQAAVHQISSNLLIDLESTLFILFKINEDCTFYESQSNLLIPFINQIFENNFLSIFTLDDNAKILNENPYILSTFMNFISSVQFYLKTNNGGKFLGIIFDILFNIILNSNTKSTLNLSLNASKTIVHICQECKNNLKNFIPNLKPLVIEMVNNSKYDNLIRKRMVNSFISITQNESPSQFGLNLFEILTNIETKSLEFMQLMNSGNLSGEDIKFMEDYLISLLGCVEECGKASVLSDEAEELFSDEEINLINKYWEIDELKIKSKILTIVNEFSLVLKPFNNNSNITEIVVQIFKSGLNEPISGPFKFEISMIFNYIIEKSSNCDSVSIIYLYKLIETIVITNSNVLNETIINQLIQEIFINKLDTINSDPDLITASIDLFSSIIDKNPGILINLSIFKDILQFAINCLGASESSIIKSISKFWNAILIIKKGSKMDQELVKTLLITENLGSILTKNLTVTFVNCPRSLLDYYYPIFRQLIGKYSPYFKNWLIDVVMSINIKLDTSQRQLFINKLMITRGQRAANDILKQFWLDSNGLIEFNSRNF